ncbi:MAG TPA: DUF5704 domain-containing protein [Lachnospiraceae bacterium]|nr:DUF5704 domain-containing protein [Lachnospiraceae bacterium]
MRKKLKVFTFLLLLLIVFIIKLIPAFASDFDGNKAKVSASNGEIKYVTTDKKASTNTTWGNLGFVIRLDKANGNPLKDKMYAMVLFSYSGVDRVVKDNNDGTKTSTYTITEEALRKALKKANMLEEFDEQVSKSEPIYFNGIFQVYHSGDPYGGALYTYKGGYDYNNKWRNGIYNAETWGDPSTFYQYFDIEVKYIPSKRPVSVEYRTVYNEVIKSENLGTELVGSKVKYNFDTTCTYQGVEYELYRSYYIDLSNKSKFLYDWSLYGIQKYSLDQIMKRTGIVGSGGLKFIGKYKPKGLPPGELETDIKQRLFEEPEPIAIIKADERNNEAFDVEEGIPVTENLYVNAFTTDYLISYRFIKKVGVKKFPVEVTKNYILNWEDRVKTGTDKKTGEPIYTYTPQTDTVQRTKTVYIERAYGYWIIDSMDVFALDSATISNKALPNTIVTLSAVGIKLPKITYAREKGLDSHVFEPKDYKESVVLDSGTVTGTYSKPAIPDEDLSIYVEGMIGQAIVKNDRLVYDGKIIIDDKKTEKEGTEPKEVPTGKVINNNVLFKNQLAIPIETANEIYESTGTVIYKSAIHIGETVTLNDISYDIGNINDVTVHTPTVCNAKISDRKEFNQMITPDKSRAALVLDTGFSIYLPTTGDHRDIKGYGYRDYSKYISEREVKFPFDVYKGTQFIPSGSWISFGSDSESFYLPTWVKEGEYTIDCRSSSINCAANNGIDNTESLANLDQYNYVATDTIDVQVSGRIYGLTLYDISDYPLWRNVFRQPDSIKLSGINYKVGTTDQNGYVTGRDVKYTVPLVKGSHPTDKNAGPIKLGYCTRFRITTIGDMSDDIDCIRLKPTFFFVDYKGQSRQEVDLYYSESFNGKMNRMVKVGSNLDMLNIKSFTIGNPYWQVPVEDIQRTSDVLGIDKEKMQAQCGQLFYFDNMVIPHQLRTFIGGGGYTPTGSIPNDVDSKEVARSVQTWYGEYYLPSDLHVLPKGYSIQKYALQNHGINFKEDIWLKHGYIIVNFTIETINDGMPYLSYSNKENAMSGYCNMWKMEGYSLNKLDTKGNLFQFKYGDYILYDTDQSAAIDYISRGTH